MKLKFLGTGAADWNGPDERGEYRRLTSTLLDGCLLIDVTKTVLDMIPNPAAVTDVFFTHSHGDHFDIDALRALAPCRVYAHESWAGEIEGEGLTVVPLSVGKPVEAACFTMIPMPSNHSTAREYETTLHYLVEKDGKRLLYATDGAWLINGEHHIIGKKVLDSAVFDATIGDGCEGDYRIFEHNSIDMIRLMLKTLYRMGRLREGAPVYLTHLARTLHPDQATLERRTEKPFIVCHDGMEAVI
ncbi:MAG: hypothetical protein IKS52_09550 [Clostridia bacterium]|nr:hypothetical protein [Clostridia bacterium]MBR4443499.1 hypothetical protein [Clostridia bacterium]